MNEEELKDILQQRLLKIRSLLYRNLGNTLSALLIEEILAGIA